MARYERYMKEISVALEIEKNKERQAEEDRFYSLSILRREYNTRQDIHMKIIVAHEKAKIQERLQDLFVKQFQTKKKKCCNWSMLKRPRLSGLFSRTASQAAMPFVNSTPIDGFVDKYFMVNCPDTLSIQEANQMVYRLILELMKKEAEYDRLTKQLKQEEKRSGEAAATEDLDSQGLDKSSAVPGANKTQLNLLEGAGATVMTSGQDEEWASAKVGRKG